jgi:hypothetical protein
MDAHSLSVSYLAGDDKLSFYLIGHKTLYAEVWDCSKPPILYASVWTLWVSF